MPTVPQLYQPTLDALKALGGSGRLESIRDAVMQRLGLSPEILSIPQKEGKLRGKLEYRLAWAFTTLKLFGALQNSERGVWSLTALGKDLDQVNVGDINVFLRERRKSSDENTDDAENPAEDDSGMTSQGAADGERFRKADLELGLFAKEAQTWFDHPDRNEVQSFHRFFQEFFKPEQLARAEWPDFQKLGDHLYALNQVALAKKRAFGEMNYTITQYRETFYKLAFESSTVEERMRWFLTNDEAASKYLGVSAISEIMAQLNPDRYVMWSARDKAAMSYLGLNDVHHRGLDEAAQFEKFNITVRHIFPRYEAIVGRMTDLPIGLEVDQFLNWIYTNRIEDAAPTIRLDESTRVWLYAPGSNADRFDELHEAKDMAIGWDLLGDLTQYKSPQAISTAIKRNYPRDDGSEPTNDARACWEFLKIIRVGDVVFAKQGRKNIVGWGIVTGPYRYISTVDYFHRRQIDWKARGNWRLPAERHLSLKTLTNISDDTEQVQFLTDLVQAGPAASAEPSVPTEVPLQPLSAQPKPYTIDDARHDVFMPVEELERARDRLSRKCNLILQGPPGVGKTYIARRLAWLLMEEQDDHRVAMVQFHQSFGYEDFVQGFRPRHDGLGFSRQDGSFLDFCHRAAADPGRKWVFIIDEINRGNISKILGELLMLIEHDKRESRYALRLALQREDEPRFWVPRNVHIIGLMNTADRSLAVIDHALRRRFAFVDLVPAFGSVELTAWLGRSWEAEVAQHLVDRIQELNALIAADADLGVGYCIGHSHFCDVAVAGLQSADDYRQVIETDIAPLLREYWFDRPKVAAERIMRLLTGFPA